MRWPVRELSLSHPSLLTRQGHCEVKQVGLNFMIRKYMVEINWQEY